MTFKTLNRVYTLVDQGDGAFLISGHPKYCPEPLLVTFVIPPMIGTAAAFAPVDQQLWTAKGFRSHVVTSQVIEVTP